MESMNQFIAGQVRTLLADIRACYPDEKLDVNHNLVPWIVRHSAWLTARFQADKDGQTPFRLANGVDYMQPICQFGEAVMAKLPESGSKSQVRWVKGIWAGKMERDDTHVLLTPAGALSARGVRRPPAPAQAQLQAMKKACGLPWDPRHTRRVRVQDPGKSQVVVLPLPTVQPPRPDSQLPDYSPSVLPGDGEDAAAPLLAQDGAGVDHEANAVEGHAQAEELAPSPSLQARPRPRTQTQMARKPLKVVYFEVPAGAHLLPRQHLCPRQLVWAQGGHRP